MPCARAPWPSTDRWRSAGRCPAGSPCRTSPPSPARPDGHPAGAADLVVGSGLSSVGPVVTDPLGTGDAVGVAELLGLADGMTDGDRDGEGDREGDADREGLGTDRVGPASELCCTLDWPVSADCCGCGGRTRKYSARMARNR